MLESILMFIFLLVLFVVLMGAPFFVSWYSERKDKKIKEKMPNGRTYYIGGYRGEGEIKKIVLNSEKLYIKRKFYINDFYDCKNIKSVKISYQLKDEIIKDNSRNIERNASLFIAGLSGFGVIIDSDSMGDLSQDILEKRLTAYIKMEMVNETVDICAINEIVKDDSLMDRLEELKSFEKDLNRIIESNRFGK